MNKKDLIPVIALALLIPVWMLIDRTFIAPKFPSKSTRKTEQLAETPPTQKSTDTNIQNKTDEPKQTALSATETEISEEEKTVTIRNNKISVKLTSLGGGIKSVTLFDYPELNEKESGPVALDFSDSAALTYDGLAGIRAKDSLSIALSEDGQSATLTKAWNSGVLFQRTISFTNDYLLNINDRFTNTSTKPWNIPSVRILTGRMENPPGMKAMKGVSMLGVDTYTPNNGIDYWAKSKIIGGSAIQKLFKEAGEPASVQGTPKDAYNLPIDWISTKNKFFVQILSPAKTNSTMEIISTRDTEAKGISPSSIAAALAFKPTIVAENNTLNLDYNYFIGPKNYSTLKATGHQYEKVMEFETTGFWSFMNWMMEPARKFLLWTLNLFHTVFHNYGIAIILLTVLIRVMFWPLTHKSTESMRRMQEVQPKVKALQEKYKKDPQRAQQEVMKFYRENKVNPMGGCLPMFVQIPVFIALFTVLRNAIELRYSGFLWIADLSQPENLFAGHVPFIGSLNILPILMSVSMIFQQKLSSPGTATTPEQQQQQKMMMFMMPIMMLFFFYSMPSGLVLYWTTSNLLMIAQTGLRNFRKKTTA